MKILIVSQYFWPENMRINDLVRDLIERGHKVTVLTGLPNYPEGSVYEDYKSNPASYSNFHGAEIVRVPMVARGSNNLSLILNYISFLVSASVIGLWRVRSSKFDVVFSYAVSPILSSIPAVLLGKRKGIPVYIWVLDLWPETLKAVGVVKSKKVLDLVGVVVRWVYDRCDYILMQSRAFEKSVLRYSSDSADPGRLIYFPSWAEDDFLGEISTESAILKPDSKVFTIVFAGNLGEAQDFPAVLDAVEATKHLPVRWVFVGDGRMTDWIKSEVATRQLENVLLPGRHPVSAMPPLFKAADALLVSLKTNEIFGMTIPGKVQTYLASGKPILAMIDGEASKVVRESGAGLSCPSGDSQGLADIVQELVEMSPTDREKMGSYGTTYYKEHFAKKSVMDKLEDLFRKERMVSRVG
ncbi:MAG: glycosyltransferase family 4 protein [Pseudomonadales bacterium]|nr:glycosyltransferase family 4 protein [Pseudomonadales bacterium]